MKIKLAFLILLLGIIAYSCSESVDEVPLEINNTQSGLTIEACRLTNTCATDTIPPAFNVSLALEHYQTDGSGMETGTISVGINRTLAHDLKIQVNYYARIPSSITYNPPYIPFNAILPVNPEFTIPAGSTISEFVDITPEMYNMCKTKVEYKIKITSITYGNWHVDPSVYTFISDPNGEAQKVLKNPLAPNNCNDGDPGLIDDISCMIAGRPCLPGDF